MKKRLVPLAVILGLCLSTTVSARHVKVHTTFDTPDELIYEYDAQYVSKYHAIFGSVWTAYSFTGSTVPTEPSTHVLVYRNNEMVIDVFPKIQEDTDSDGVLYMGAGMRDSHHWFRNGGYGQRVGVHYYFDPPITGVDVTFDYNNDRVYPEGYSYLQEDVYKAELLIAVQFLCPDGYQRSKFIPAVKWEDSAGQGWNTYTVPAKVISEATLWYNTYFPDWPRPAEGYPVVTVQLYEHHMLRVEHGKSYLDNIIINGVNDEPDPEPVVTKSATDMSYKVKKAKSNNGKHLGHEHSKHHGYGK